MIQDEKYTLSLIIIFARKKKKDLVMYDIWPEKEIGGFIIVASLASLL